MFGESLHDKRDFTMGLAGFIAGLHSLRILAERGVASAEDMWVSLEGIRQILAHLPDSAISREQLLGIEKMLDEIHAASIRSDLDKAGQEG